MEKLKDTLQSMSADQEGTHEMELKCTALSTNMKKLQVWMFANYQKLVWWFLTLKILFVEIINPV